MKTDPPTTETPTPTPASPSPQAIADATILPAIPLRPAAIAENIMPYEAAAKAIFVKANGLPAYYKATGRARRAD